MSKKPKNFDNSIRVLELRIDVLKSNIKYFQEKGREEKSDRRSKMNWEYNIEQNKIVLNELWYAKKLLSENKP